MLVLTRRLEQGLRIGRDVRVVVLEICGDQVRLGIEAPREQAILRDELFSRAAQANSQALETTGAERWVEIAHAKLGSLRFPEEKIIEIDQIAGFPDARRFVLIAHDRGDGIGWLASCEDLTLAFPVLDLRALRSDVCEQLTQPELSHVGADDASQVELLGILNMKGTTPLPNLDAPLLVHCGMRRGTQLIREQPIALK